MGRYFFLTVFLILGFHLARIERKYSRLSLYVWRLICFVVGHLRLIFTHRTCKQRHNQDWRKKSTRYQIYGNIYKISSMVEIDFISSNLTIMVVMMQVLGGKNYRIRGSFTLFIVIVNSTNSENSVNNRSVLSSLTKGRGTSISALTIHALLNQRNSKVAWEDLCFTSYKRKRK